MSAIVHYIKHWDNDTKGSIEFAETNDIVSAVWQAREQLVSDAVEDGYITSDQAKSSFAFSDVATITKAEIVDSVQAYAGVPKANF